MLVAQAFASGQPLRVYSEYRRVDPFGALLEGEPRPREVLSPGAPRNGFSSFRIAVTLPPGTSYSLHIGQNPDNATTITLYREKFAQVNGKWTPVTLEQVGIPFETRIPEGQTTQTFWMDVWVDKDAPVRRIKVEPQVNVGERWVVYPMEVRVVGAQIPPTPSTPVPGFREYFCGGNGHNREAAAAAGTPEALSQRNRAQDILLAQQIEKERSHPLLTAQLATRLGVREPKVWCTGPAPADPEWFLKVHDFLLRGPGFN